MIKKLVFLALLLVLSTSALLTAQDSVTLTYLVDDSQNSQDMAKALVTA